MHGGPILGRDAEGDAAHRAAGREAQHQARRLRHAAVVNRIDAERPPAAMQHRPLALDMCKPRPPHQRAVAEHPSVARAVGETGHAPTLCGAPARPASPRRVARRRSMTMVRRFLPRGTSWTIRGPPCLACARASTRSIPPCWRWWKNGPGSPRPWSRPRPPRLRDPLLSVSGPRARPRCSAACSPCRTRPPTPPRS